MGISGRDPVSDSYLLAKRHVMLTLGSNTPSRFSMPRRLFSGKVRYSRLLEEGDFRGRTGDFVWFLLFCAALMTGAAPFLGMNFLGRPLAFMMVYVWGRWAARPSQE